MMMLLMPWWCGKSSSAMLAAVALALLLHAASLPAVGAGLARRHRRDVATPSGSGLAGCDVFSGGWVLDDGHAAASYTGFNCPVIDAEFNCQMYGRPDSEYLRYKWKPAGCELPRFDGADLLTRMKGKTVMFVGDSLGRNQVGVAHLPAPRRRAAVSRRRRSSSPGTLSTHTSSWYAVLLCLQHFPTYIACVRSICVVFLLVSMIPLNMEYMSRSTRYGVTVSTVHRAPYLVDIDEVQGKRVLMLDDVSGNSEAWRGADVLSPSTPATGGRTPARCWWGDYMGESGRYFQDMDRMVAFQHTASPPGPAGWTPTSILPRPASSSSPCRPRTTGTLLLCSAADLIPVLFYCTRDTLGVPVHITRACALGLWHTSKEWANPVSKNCYGETAPVTGLNSTAAGQASGQDQVIQAVLRGMKSPVRLLDISAMSALRKDAHPSVYSGDLSPAQRANPGGSVDCSHWCLPGLPDTWNQLFYTLLFYK
ncbi:hypothetical protein PR202_gb19511 [Eleusine coracana subsp. coracana]|uniref:Trichome birefringence-like N-terminal domain-containing protein n=1 Tax=Eleusine coracana subsp. coracana TaxID=191504 RepID=A0AAV5F680_ELECO|nr:hypothetical protein PR202_gb19511 [Eleusine coracana subsp. coracana]